MIFAGVKTACGIRSFGHRMYPEAPMDNTISDEESGVCTLVGENHTGATHGHSNDATHPSIISLADRSKLHS